MAQPLARPPPAAWPVLLLPAQPVQPETLTLPMKIPRPVSNISPLYAQMDAAGIPEPILDHIAHQVHRLRFKDGLKEAIDALPSVFERDLLNPTKGFKEILNRHASYIFVDKEVSNVFTVVLELTTKTFFIFTLYHNGAYEEHMLMEIRVKNDLETQLLRFYRDAQEEGETGTTPFELFRQAHYDTVRWDSLNYLEYLCQIDRDTMNRMTIHLESPWKNPAAMIAWFRRHENDFSALTADPTIGRTTPI